MSTVRGAKVLLARVGSCCAAIPADWVIETMRPLPVEVLAGAPAYLLGVSVIRGRPTPVIDLARLLLQGDSLAIKRFITVRTADRPAALAVHAVVGVETLVPSEFSALPPLLQSTSPEILAGIDATDHHLLLVLQAARLLSPELEALLIAKEGAA